MADVRRLVVAGVVASAVGVAVAACGGDPASEEGSPVGDLSLVSTLGGADTVGYARATEVRDFVFPEDHGPHPDFRTEWWYVTGNLTAESGRAFGFQFTIFRSALAPTPPGGPSEWATNQAYMGHFAVTDVTGEAFRAAELFARGSGGLAGARTTPLRVWIEDWALESVSAGSDVEGGEGEDATTGNGISAGDGVVAGEGTGGDGSTSADAPGSPEGAGEDAQPVSAEASDEGTSDAGSAEGGAAGGDGTAFPLRLTADGRGVMLDLVLESGKPRVLQGDRGLSQKGPEPGNASYYYAHTRMPARGELVWDGERYRVSGLAWMDREWSTSALSEGQVGWDWFALQLDDGWEMMVYQLRQEDGTASPLSDGVLIDPRGRRIPLEWGEDITVTPTDTWASPLDGAEYPSGWRIQVPDRGWDLTVEPTVRDQELRLAFRYWEGAVRVRGTGEGGAPVEGRGYVELTGYDGGLGGG